MSTWKILSAIDCSAHTEQKGQFTYLSWTWAWAMVKENFPDASYVIEPDIIYPDGTMEVRCTVTIDGLSNTMWLPVLDFKNKAIKEPNAFDINSSRMRVLVKCLAMHGLGHYIYAGESVPQAEPYTAEQLATYRELLAKGTALEYLQFMHDAGTDTQTALHNSWEKGDKVAMKKKAGDLEAEAHRILDQSATDISVEAIADDPHALHQLKELAATGKFIKVALWSRLSRDVQAILTEMSKADV